LHSFIQQPYSEQTGEGRAGGALTSTQEAISMGFLKRIFSIGSKKDKNSKKHELVYPQVQSLHDEEEHEVTVGRLLRSSSTRYAVVSETDYASLPPMRKSVNLF
jgi:hypothetical protein